MSLLSRTSRLTWILPIAFILSVQFGAGQGPLVPPGMRLIVVASAAEAEQLTNQLRAGADFAALAKERSIDPTSADGGYLGRLDPSTLRPELRVVVAQLKPGEISEVVRIPTGFADSENSAGLRGIAGDQPESQPHPGRCGAGSGVLQRCRCPASPKRRRSFCAFPKPAGWNQDLQAVCDIRRQSIPTAIEQ